MNTAKTIEGHGILGLSSPWARARIREPLRSELAALIPEGYTIGVSVDPNNARCKVWVNLPDGTVNAHEARGYDAEAHVRSAIAWIGAQG